MNDITKCIYTSRTGTNFRYRMNAEVLGQDDGGDPAVRLVGDDPDAVNADALLRLPSSVTPRRARVVSAAEKSRYVVILNEDAPLWTGAETQVVLEDSDGAPTTYTVRDLLPEKFGRG